MGEGQKEIQQQLTNQNEPEKERGGEEREGREGGEERGERRGGVRREGWRCKVKVVK